MQCTHNLITGKPCLCRACQDDYDDDPDAWIECGNHPAGNARMEEILREYAEVKHYETPEDAPL